jgi:hypothetical protein
MVRYIVAKQASRFAGAWRSTLRVQSYGVSAGSGGMMGH